MVRFLLVNRLQWGFIYIQRLLRATRERISKETVHGLVTMASPRRRIRSQLLVIGFIVTCILFLHFGYLTIVDNYYTRCHHGMYPFGSNCDEHHNISVVDVSKAVRTSTQPNYTEDYTGTIPDVAVEIPHSEPEYEDQCPVFVYSPRHIVLGSPFPVIIKTNKSSDTGTTLSMRQAFFVSALHQDARHGFSATGTLYFGAGSTSILLNFPGHYTLQVQVNDTACERPVIRSLEVHPQEGTLKDIESVKFSNVIAWKGPIVTVKEDVIVPRGEILKIMDGTTVLLAPNVNMVIEGELHVGTMSGANTLFSCLPNLNQGAPRSWGQIKVLSDGIARFENTWLTCGGGNHSAATTKSKSQAVVELQRDAVLTMISGGIVDNEGTGLAAEGSTVQLHDIVISRCDMGAELHRTILDMERSYILEIPNGLHEMRDQDNDALFITGSHPTGTYSRIRNCILAVGDDDAIQTDSAFVIIKSSVIDSYFNTGISSSGSIAGDIVLSNLFVTNCHAALRIGFGNPQVSVHSCEFYDNWIGVMYGDKYSNTNYQGTLTMDGVIIAQSKITPLHFLWSGMDDEGVMQYSIDPHRMRYRCVMVDIPIVLPQLRGDIDKGHLVQEDNEGIGCMVKVTHDMMQEDFMSYGIQLTDVKALHMLPPNMTRDTCPPTSLQAMESTMLQVPGAFLPAKTVAHFRLSGIGGFQQRSYTQEELSKWKKKLCNLRFHATLYAQDSNGVCSSHQVQVGADSTDMKHVHAVLTCALDSVLGTSLCPGFFLLILDATLPQVETRQQAQQITESLNCIPKIASKYIPTMATAWSPDIKSHSWPDTSLQNNPDYSLVLYLANCQMGAESHHAKVTMTKLEDGSTTASLRYMLMETSRCLGKGYTGTETQPNDALDISTFVFFKQQNLCSTNRSLLEMLDEMSTVNSQVASLGLTMRSKLDNTTYAGNELERHFMEIDGRVSTVVSEYIHKCLPSVFTRLHEFYSTLSVVKLEPLFEGLYLTGELQQKVTGVFKPIWATTTRAVGLNYVNQGPAELVTHYTDLILGFRVTPIVVHRRLLVVPGCNVPLRPGTKCPKGHASIEMPLLASTTGEHLPTLLSQTQHDPNLDQFYINFAFLPLIKDLQMGVKVKSAMFKFFTHQLQATDMRTEGIAMQDLRDVADIILLDFLTHNPGRYHSKYWAKSEGRFFAFDNSFSFWHTLDNPVCHRLLTCPPIFCSKDHIMDAEECGQQEPLESSMCRFTRNSVARLTRLGPAAPMEDTAGFMLRRILQRQSWYSNEYLGYFGSFDVPKSLDLRISFALEHIEQCRRRFRESVFI